MKVPMIDQAKNFLEEARRMNPGPWVEHSYYVAEAAALIAERHPDMDRDTSYVIGLLHDIGRREGVFHMRHSMDGYKYLSNMGYEDAARICITHSFAYKDINAVCGKWDCSREEYEFAHEFLSKIEYNDYDRIIQLCDALALPSGFCLLEKRMVDVALRYGTTDYTVSKWKQIFKIKKDFESKIGCSIYSLLPGIVKNTFETDQLI